MLARFFRTGPSDIRVKLSDLIVETRSVLAAVQNAGGGDVMRKWGFVALTG